MGLINLNLVLNRARFTHWTSPNFLSIQFSIEHGEIIDVFYNLMTLGLLSHWSKNKNNS